MSKTKLLDSDSMSRDGVAAQTPPAPIVPAVPLETPPQNYLTQSQANAAAPADKSNAKCRFCLDGDDPDDLIAPCLCKGSSKWIHRKKCLDPWRAANPNSNAFTHCSTCGYKFWIEVRDQEVRQRRCCGESLRVWKYRGLVARDTTMAFMLLNLAVITLAFAISVMDSCGGGKCGGKDGPLFRAFSWICFGQVVCLGDHYKTTYYLIGLLSLFFMSGLVACFQGMMAMCCSGDNSGDAVDSCENTCVGCCCPRSYYYGPGYYGNDCCCICCNSSPHHHHHHHHGGGDCGDCGNCGGCHCNCNGNGGGGDCGEAGGILFVIAIVAVLIIIFAGILYGLVIASLVISRIAQRHYHVFQRKVLAGEYSVMDLDGVILNPDDPHMPRPTAPEYDDSVLRTYGVIV